MDVFWRRGFAATTLDDLVAASRASRASLYATFGDKERLFARALDLYAARFEQRVEEALAHEPTARAALVSLFHASADRLADPDAPPGCLRCNSTLELAGTGGGIGDALADANHRFAAAMERIVGRGLAAGEIGPPAAAGLPLVLTGAVNGMVTLAKGGAGRAELQIFLDRILSLWPEPNLGPPGGVR